ncbi:hypothetical protein [Alkalihalobacterium alkalinitrilicum]|uniref:hypothetical protein n=1 Tax=Alkalihalobacterium alkalinitrilicum TaxID=427920 RepID=UPI001303F126
MEALDYLYKKGHQKIGYCIGRKSGNSQLRQLDSDLSNKELTFCLIERGTV